MSKKVILIILIVSVAINLATVVTFVYFWASERKPQPHLGHRFPEWQKNHLEKELQLKQEQIKEMQKVHEEIRVNTEPIRQEMVNRRRELMMLLQEQEVDKERIKQLIKEIAQIQAEHDMRIFQGILEIKDMLTPEQRGRFHVLLHELLGPRGPEGRPCDPPSPHPPHPPLHKGQ